VFASEVWGWLREDFRGNIQATKCIQTYRDLPSDGADPGVVDDSHFSQYSGTAASSEKVCWRSKVWLRKRLVTIVNIEHLVSIIDDCKAAE